MVDAALIGAADFQKSASMASDFVNCTELGQLLITDKLQIGHQLLAASLGLPINLVFCIKILIALRAQYRRVLCLNLLLTVSHLCVLLLCIWYTVWLLGFWWSGGRAACKLFSFLSVFVFYFYSNCTVSIALEMLIAVRYPFFNYRHSRCLVVTLASASVLLATVTSLPQLVFWDLDTVTCSETGLKESQCSYMFPDKTWYSVLHNLVIFWVPLCLIIPAYVIVSRCVWQHYRTNVAADNYRSNASSTTDLRRIASTNTTSWFSRLQRRRSDISDSMIDSDETPPANQYGGAEQSGRGLDTENPIAPITAIYRMQGRISLDSLRSMKKRSSAEAPIIAARLSDADQQPILSNSNERRSSLTGLRRTFQPSIKLRSKRLRVIKSSLAIVSIYIISWLPYQVCSIWSLAHPESAEQDDVKIYLECLEAFMFAGTVINPFLYRFTMSKRKKAVAKNAAGH